MKAYRLTHREGDKDVTVHIFPDEEAARMYAGILLNLMADDGIVINERAKFDWVVRRKGERRFLSNVRIEMIDVDPSSMMYKLLGGE